MKKIFTYRKDIYFIIVVLLLISILGLVLEVPAEKSINNPYNIKVSEKDNFLFLGDSLTDWYNLEEFYDDLPVVNSGIAGNTTNDILENIEERVVIYNPTKIFILIGTNDIGGKSNKEIVNNIKKIVDNIKQKRPYAKIYIESLLPVNTTNDAKINKETVGKRNNKIISEINYLLKEYANDNKITYINLYKEFIDKDNQLYLKYTSDGLHLSNLGYLHLTKILLPYLNE